MRIRTVMMTTLLFAAAACNPGPGEPPVLVEAVQIEPLLVYSSELDGRRVSIDGYVHIDTEVGDVGVAMVYTLTSRPRGLGEDLIDFEAKRGTKPNTLDLKVIETEQLPGGPGGMEVLHVDLADSRFVDGAGVAHSVRDKVRVTGELASFSAVEDPRSPTGRRYSPRLLDTTFEAAP